jgi:sugar diacid utilization regulator
MNAQKTALALGIHPNTVYSRMQRIEQLTGLNALKFDALSELLLALDWAHGIELVRASRSAPTDSFGSGG